MSKTCGHLAMEKDGEKITENLFFYLPDKYVDWPDTKITTQLSQITDKQWKLKLKSNTVTKDIQILSDRPAQFSENFIDLVPPDKFEITINCRQRTPLLESALQLRFLKSITSD